MRFNELAKPAGQNDAGYKAIVRDFLNAVPEALAVIDDDGRIIHWNDEFTSLVDTGTDQSEIDFSTLLLTTFVAQYHHARKRITTEQNTTASFDAVMLSQRQPLGVRCRLRRSSVAGADITLLSLTVITSRQTTDDSSDQRLHDLIAGSVQGMVVYGHHKPLFCTDLFAQLFGYASPADFLTNGPKQEYELLVEDHRDALQKLSEEADQSAFELDEHFELRALRRNGEEIWVDLRRRAITWNGQYAHMITVYDITRRKKVELRFHESGAFLQRMMDDAQAVVFYVNRSGSILLSNRALEDLVGVKRDEIIGQPITDYLPANIVRRQARRFQRVWNGQSVLINQTLKDASGRRRSFSAHIVPETTLDGGVRGAFIVALDITEQEESARALRISERRYRTLVEGSLQGIAVLKGTEVVFANDAWARILGYSNFRSFFESSHDRNILTHLDGPEATELERILTSTSLHKGMAPREVKIVLHDGRRVWIEYLISSFILGREQLIQLTAVDITARKTGEIALHNSDILLRGLINSSNALVACLDREGRYIFANNAIADILGIPADLLTGMKATEDNNNKKGYFTSAQNFNLALNGESITFQAELRNKNNEMMTFECHFRPRWQREDIVGVFIFAFDVSERVRAAFELKKSEERFRKLIDIMPYGISRTDLTGRLRLTNPAHDAMLAYDPGELTDRSVWEMFVPEEQDLQREIFFRAMSERPQPYPNVGRCLRKDGKVIDVLFYWSYEYDETGAVSGFISVLTDVTEELIAKRELKHAKDMAERANIEKSRFLAAASHDLQQPLHSLSILLGLLHKPQSTERQHEIIHMMERAVSGSQTLLRAVLDLSKLEAGVVVPRFEPIPIQDLFDEVAAELSALLEDRPVSIHIVHSSAQVRSDRILLKSIVHNLVSNAIRYTPQGKILLGVRKLGDNLEIQVWDTGKGIPKDRQQDIFREFTRLERSDTDDKVQGLGLGLSIVERSCQLLEHPLRLESEPGKGSMFAIQVPLVVWRGSRYSNPAILPSAAYEPRTAIILLIEDDATTALATRQLVEDWGYRCFVALTEEDAVALVKNEGQRPELILADYNLDDNNTGIAVAEIVYGLVGRKLPTILITANETDECRFAASSRNIPVINKPANPARLRSLISYCLAQAINEDDVKME